MSSSNGYYGVTFPTYWTGPTGRELRARGGKDAQLLGLYLTSNRFANMIGLYHLTLDDIRHETGLTVKGIARAFETTAAASYATFDSGSAFVWVRQMVRFRLNLKAGQALAPDDHRVVGVNRLYQGLAANPFLGEFFDVHGKTLRLKRRRDSVGLVVGLVGHHNGSPLQGASKGLVSQ